MSDTYGFDGISVTRYVGPDSLEDRRRIQLLIHDGSMQSSPNGPIAIRDFDRAEAYKLARCLIEALEPGS